MKAVIISDIDAENINVLSGYVLRKDHKLSGIVGSRSPIVIAKNTAYIMRSISDAPSMDFFKEVHRKGGVVYCHNENIDTGSTISKANPTIKWMFQ